MSDREPDTHASELLQAGAGWSFARALATESKRGQTAANLSRHLAGHRVAGPAPDAPSDDAPRAAEDAALIARDAMAGEAAWADSRLALIERAVEAEAGRLAQDPAKAGKVAEHLAPLIGKAFAGALAEAPGDHAKAIVEREREPLETEILAKRAVMSVAARQAADRNGRRAAIDDEIAALKTDPQRWASVTSRRGRLIDDLPLDEPRKRQMKETIARAQAQAAAEGLYRQNPDWLLEDLADPAFANALGKQGRKRWRREAETAIARRAERIAAESAERAALAATEMRNRLKEAAKGDDPLPAEEEVAAMLGDEAAGALEKAANERLRRHAEKAVAVMAPADEQGWIAAAADEAMRAARKAAAAKKRAALDADPGGYLMEHSATLGELADAATDDPAKLPLLVDRFTTLQERIGVAPGRMQLLPDAVAADLADRLLAGETPQARFDALTDLLGAAGADGAARAGEIATLLEGFGLPAGTAAQWSLLENPRTRRAARLALLGGFARQIADEERVLSGESAPTEILGGGDRDTLSVFDAEFGDYGTDRRPPSRRFLERSAFARERALRQDGIRERIRQLVDAGAVPQDVADRFLEDERLRAVEAAAVPDDVAERLQMGDNAALIGVLSDVSDVVLGIAEKFAELEEEYGWFATAAFYGTHALIGGPVKALAGFLIDRGFDAFLGDTVAEGMQFAIGKGASLLQTELGIQDEVLAERISSAGILIVVSVAAGAGIALRVLRHVGRSIRERLGVGNAGNIGNASDNGSKGVLDDDPFYDGKPETKKKMEAILAKRSDQTNLQYMDELLADPKWEHLSPEVKRELAAYYSFGVFGRALEIHLANELRPLAAREGFTLLEQFRINTGIGNRFTIVDLVMVNGQLNPAHTDNIMKNLFSYADEVPTNLIEAKTGGGRMSARQRDMSRGMSERGQGDSYKLVQFPARDIPADAILKAMKEVKLTDFKYITDEMVKEVFESALRNARPGTSVWEVVVVAVAALGMIDQALAEQE